MSPTYWTASRIKNAAVAHGWTLVPVTPPSQAWGAEKGRHRVMVQERRDGGLVAVWIHYPIASGFAVDYYGPRFKGKLELVLRQIEEGEWLQRWMTEEWLTWWKSLDHSNCARYAANTIEETEKQMSWPDYQTCRSMHCPDCGKPTGGQGHRNCPERKGP